MSEWESAPLYDDKPAEPKALWESAPLYGDAVAPAIVGGAQTDPGAAAKALEISKKTGVPAHLLTDDIKSNIVDFNARTGVTAAASHPAIADYAASHPLATQVSADDWGSLANVSKKIGEFENRVADWWKRVDSAEQARVAAMPTWRRVLAAPSEAAAGLVSGAVTGAVKGFGYGGPGTWISDKDKLNAAGVAGWTALGLPLEAIIRGGAAALVGTAEGLGEAGARFYGTVTGDKMAGERFGREISAVAESYIAGLSGAHPITSVPEKVAQRILLSEQMDRAIGDAVGKVDSLKAHADLAKAVEAAHETQTRARSPELFAENFVSQTNAAKTPLFMSADSIRKLYEESGVEIGDPKGPLGFIGNLSAQLQRADKYGTEVTVAFQDYLANVAPALHDKIGRDLRIGEGGSTPNEIVAGLGEKVEKPAEAAKEAPPKPTQAEAQAIAAQEDALGLRPVFSEAPPDVTKPVFERYSRLIAQQQEALAERLQVQAEAQAKRRLKPDWVETYGEEFTKAKDELARTPEYSAERAFRAGMLPDETTFVVDGRPVSLKLDAAAVRSMLPEADLSRYTRKEGIDPEVAAKYFGFDSGVDMLRAIEAIQAEQREMGLGPKPHFEYAAKEIATERTEARIGNLAENIAAVAKEIVAGQDRINILHAELEMMAKAAGVKIPYSKEAIVRAVGHDFANESVKDGLNTRRYERDMQREWKNVEKALAKAKPDYIEAFKARQRQLAAFIAWKEAREFARDYGKFERAIEGPLTKDVVLSIAQRYTDQIQGLLADYGYTLRRKSDSLARALENKSLDKFVEEETRSGYKDIELSLPDKSNAADFTVGDMRDFMDTVKSLIKNGREDSKITRGEQAFDRAQVEAEAVNNLKDLKGNFDPNDKSLVRWAVSGLVRPERLLDWLDKKDPLGVFNAVVFRPLAEAKHWKTDKIREISKALADLPDTFEWRKSLRDTVENTELIDPRTGAPMKMTRQKLIAMALNTGTDSNLKTLVKGYGWETDTVLNFIDRNMTRQDWDMVEGIWGIWDKHLKKDVIERTERMRGVSITLPSEITRTLPDGRVIEGKYYPLEGDPLYKLEHVKAGKEEFDPAFYKVLPDTAALHARTGAIYPLRLDISGIASRLADTVHALAYREAVINAKKLLDSPEVRRGVSEAFGPEYTAEFTPWLDYIATNGGTKDQSFASWLAQENRANAQAMMIGFNLVTPLLHGGSALVNSIEQVGLLTFLKTANATIKDQVYDVSARMLNNPNIGRGMVKEAMEQSGELRNRMHNLDDNLGYMLEKMSSSKGIGELLKEAGHGTVSVRDVAPAVAQSRQWFLQKSMFLVAALDQASAVPVWIAARDAALGEGRSLKDAVYIADKALRNAHGASGIVDIAPVQRNVMMKAFSMFYNYFNHNTNQLLDAYFTIAKNLPRERGRSTWQFLAERGIYYLAVPAMIHHALRGHSDPDEGKGKTIAKALTTQITGGVPFVRDAWYGIESGREIRYTAMEKPLQALIDAMRDVSRETGVSKGKVSKNWVKHAVTAPAVIGLSSAQIGRTTQFFYDWNTGRQVPHGFGELASGVIYGQVRQKKH